MVNAETGLELGRNNVGGTAQEHLSGDHDTSEPQDEFVEAAQQPCHEIDLFLQELERARQSPSESGGAFYRKMAKQTGRGARGRMNPKPKK